MEEAIWQEHVYILEKAIGVGFGIAISGGKDNPGMQTGDPSIVISDVIKGGPAHDKLKVNDIVLRVNGKPMFNMEHSKAVRELKNAGQRVELKIKRKVMVRVSPPPERTRRSRSRDVDSPHRRRSRSRDYDRNRPRSRSRDYNDSRRKHRSRSRDIDSPRSRRSKRRSPSRSSSRGRSYSRSPSYSRRSHSRGSNPSYRRGRSRSRSRSPSLRRSRSPSPSYRRHRSRSRASSKSSYRSRSPSPRPNRSRNKMEKHRPVNDLRSSSPLSPDPDSANYSDPEMMVFPVKLREPKPVVLKKTKQNKSYGLKLGTRIFIQDIQPGSLADKDKELTSGDTVLMINGRNMDNKSVQDAIQIIGQNKDKVTMLVKKEDGGTVSLPADRFRSPERGKREEPREEKSRRHSRRSSLSKQSSRSSRRRSSASEPRSRKADKKQSGGIKVLPTSSLPRRHSSTSRSTPEPAPRSRHERLEREYSEPPGPEEDDGSLLPASSRQIVFTKAKNVGIRLAGGNDVGIFVASVQEGSPAAKQGLKMGDKILSVNEVSFKNTIREDAVVTLMGLQVGEKVKIIAQAQPDQYKKVLEHGTGDSFYIRTHFKYEKSAQHELSFTRGSAFHISDTLYQGMVGYWLAVRIGRNSKEIERGVIPNSNRAEQLKMVQDKKRTALRERSNRGISRRIKMQKSDPGVASSTSEMFPAYERVVLREAGFKRPVVIFGPLADVARQRLAGDYYDSYEVARNEGVVKGQKSNRKGVIRLNTIKDIIEQDKHAILDITPTAVEKLNYAQLYPIVVYLEASSKNLVKTLRSKLATTDEERKKKAGKLYDRSNKLHRGYSHVFTDTIRLDESDGWYRRLHSTIKDQQGMPVWVSKDKLGGGSDDADEGVTVPGDDDQLSYVSAPASDYSVTTVGSDILNNSRFSDEEEDHVRRKHEPKTKAPSSSEEEDAGNKFGDDDFDDASEEEPLPDHVVAPPTISKPVSTATSSKTKTTQPKAVPVRQPSSSSSSSSEDEPPAPVSPKTPSRYPTRIEQQQESPTRGAKEIPAGRFDPQSFLKNHIRGLKSVSKDEPQDDAVTRPSYRHESPVSNTRATPSYNSPPAEKPEPQQPMYAQVNKNRPKQTSALTQRDRRDGAGRDPAEDYNSYPSYKTNNARPMENRAPVRQEPTRNAPPPATYNRFAGSTQAKADTRPTNSYNPTKSPYQRPPMANGMPQKSNLMQDRYRDKVDPYNQNRPYNGPPTQKSNYIGHGNKEQMYDSGVDTYYNAKHKKDSVPVSPTNIEEEDPQVVATAKGVFDSNGGVLSSVETGVSIVIPKGAIRPGVRQEIYFKVCRDNTALPPLDKNKGETLLSPLVMCGPHGLQFDHPVELRLPHCEPSQWPNEGNDFETGGNSVSVLIDHF